MLNALRRLSTRRGPGFTRWIACLLALMSLLAACGEPAGERLVITGSSTMAPLIADLAELHERRTGVRVDVQSGGSSRGIHDVRTGLAGVGMASRSLTEDEQADGLVAHAIAWDGIALILHRDNPVVALHRDEVIALYRGEIRNWRELGGVDRTVTVINKADGRSTLALFLEAFGLAGDAIAADLVAGENQQVILSVAGNPGAIGYVSIGSAEVAMASETAIKRLPLDGQEASVRAVRDGRYPLRRALNLVTLGTPSPAARAFIDSLRSADSREIVHAHYFVPVSP